MKNMNFDVKAKIAYKEMENQYQKYKANSNKQLRQLANESVNIKKDQVFLSNRDNLGSIKYDNSEKNIKNLKYKSKYSFLCEQIDQNKNQSNVEENSQNNQTNNKEQNNSNDIVLSNSNHELDKIDSFNPNTNNKPTDNKEFFTNKYKAILQRFDYN